MPTGIAIRKSVQVGAVPKKLRFSIRISGLRTRNTPATTSASWLMKSITASTTLTLTASFTPRTFTSASSAIRMTAKTMSPGAVLNQSTPRPPA